MFFQKFKVKDFIKTMSAYINKSVIKYKLHYVIKSFKIKQSFKLVEDCFKLNFLFKNTANKGF